MMAVYGMLAADLALFCVRYLIPPDRWSERLASISFWSLNVGLAWMCFATLFPLGILQLYESVNHGYFEARSLEFLTSSTNALIEWLRFPGDLVHRRRCAAAVLPVLAGGALSDRENDPRRAGAPAVYGGDRAGHYPMMTYLESIRLETLLGAGYVVVLLLVALVLEHAARLVHRRSEGYETAGFRYHAALDACECPMGEHLLLVQVAGHGRPLARYRARATACNSCPIKGDCTDSDTGRELERTLDDWPRSDIAHFYRGLSLALVGLAVFITSAGLARNHGQMDVLVLGAALALALVVGHRLWRPSTHDRSDEKAAGNPDSS